MSHRFERGLVVGKFCPLHRGHELLIERAAAACRELIVFSYTNPEFERCEPAAREYWFAARFPAVRRLILDEAVLRELCASRGLGPPPPLPLNEAGADDHRAFVGWLCRNVLATAVDAVFTSEAYGDGFAAALTKSFVAHGLLSRPVEHVCIDQSRSTIPISATQIRADPHRYKWSLAPDVYASFVERVCLLGGESTGKSSLARALALRHDTHWAAERGRELWEQQGGVLAFDDMAAIASEQIARENDLSKTSTRWLFCDSSPLTTLFYSLEMFGSADPAVETHARRKYDYTFLCAPDFAFVQDGTRRDELFRAHQHQWYLRELERRGIEFALVEGSLDERIETVTEIISKRSR